MQLCCVYYMFLLQIDAEDLVFSLEALVEKFGHEIAPYAAQMVQQLAAAYDKYTSSQDDEDEDADDMGKQAPHLNTAWKTENCKHSQTCAYAWHVQARHVHVFQALFRCSKVAADQNPQRDFI